MYGYIYITTNLVNGKQYIGRKTSPIFVETYKGSGVGIKKAIKKYGIENFQVKILKWCSSYEELVESETYYIKLYDAVNNPNYYNQSYGGYDEGFCVGENNIAKTEYAKQINSEKHKGKKMSEEFKQKQSELHKGKPSGMLGHQHSDETKKRISEASKNQKHTAERDKKVSENHKGTRFMNNGVVQKWAKKEEIEKYLQEGWQFGSCKKRNREYPTGNKSNLSSPNMRRNDRIWIHKGNTKKWILKEELEKFLQDSWLLGMK